ncbi:hypothetical protein OG21DRAFT_1599543 [Imleria badia]|nr:hypothetical protein OG21DRAFT_1599543 [Imleria badia]
MSSQEPQSSVDPRDKQHALYQKNRDSATFDLAIRHYCAAFDLGPAPDTKVDCLLSYFRFHHALLLRHQEQGGDHTIANKYLDKVLEFTPATHHLRPVLLSLQAASYTKRYQHTKDIADLHTAVEIFRTATDTIPATHPQRAHLLMQYASALHTRFMVLKDENDLNLAIQHFETVLEGCPEPLLIPTRRALAFALDSRYKLRYDINDVERAVEAYAAVIDMLQQEPMENLFVCMGYAVVLRVWFYRKGNLGDLHVAIRYFEIVIRRCPPSHEHYFIAVTFYATLLITRSEQRESIQDIDTAIGCIRNGMTVGRADDPSRPELVSILGYCLTSRFLHCGSAADLESAVENCYTGVSSDSSLNAGARAGNMSRLAFALFTRYQLQGDEMDSTRAKTYLKQALELCPSGLPIRLTILNNGGRIFANLAKKNSDPSRARADLELSIEYFYEALDLCYESARSVILTNLAVALLYRYSLLGDLSDIDVAFLLSKASLELRAEDHWLRGLTFLVQAKAVIAMFPRRRTTVDTEIALDILHAARDAFTPGHAMLVEMYRELSNVHLMRHAITNSSIDLEDAFKYRIAAAQYSNGGSQVRFEAAMQWVEGAEKFNHPSMLDAYRSAIRILDLHLVLKPSVNLRHDIIKKQALSICVDATSCALRRQDVVGAVEMFEQSRGLFWTFMARLRTPLDELRASGPGGRDLADEFESLSRQLEMPMTLGDDGEYGQKFRRLHRDWNAAVDKIRSTDGFDKFLLPPSYEDLRVAAIGGPVIILNASRHSCDAVIVLANAEPIHIAFQQGTLSEIDVMSSDFEVVRHRLRQYPNDSDSEEKKEDERKLLGLLRGLWNSIVCEVVRRLEPHVPKNSRIWWCPTGVFTSLPIHAAHPYRGKGERGLSDVYVSSYTPTLSALIRSRNKRNAQQGVPSFVSIGQPDSAGYNLLVTVRQELDLVRQLLPESVRFTELTDEAATREAALTALRTHTFAHLACHGQQVLERPYNSHFAMHDGHLTLLDIVHSQVGHETEFAFLSACKTATGDVDAPDEVIHLAAALQFAGVGNVVGTMSSVDDQVVVYTVEAFYRAMVREDGVFDPSRAARALRAATRATKDRVPLDQRIVFIHIGV